MPRDGATPDDASVRITDLGAPSPVAAADLAPSQHPEARRRRALAVAGLLLLAGAAYTATAVPAPPSATTPVQPQAGAPLDVCSVNPDACPSPVPTDARVRFLPDRLTSTTGSVIICDPDTGACAPRREGTFSACDVVESLRAGLGRLPQEVTTNLSLPEGQAPFVAAGPGGILSAVGIAYPDGTVSVCGPIEWPSRTYGH